MDEKPFLSVIIPAYNEAKRIALTLIDIHRHLSKQDFSYEILVASDGSKDETIEITERLSHFIPRLRFIDNEENHGKGWVVRQGMLKAKGEWRLFTDADNSTSVDQIGKMLPYFKEGYEIVIGSRDIPGAKMSPPQPWYKRFMGNMGNLIIQLLLLPGIKDTQCGFKCFSAKAAEDVFGKTRIDRWAFDAEALSLAKRLGYRIKEVPVLWVNDSHSKVKFSGYLKSLLEVKKVRWWLWTGGYKLIK